MVLNKKKSILMSVVIFILSIACSLVLMSLFSNNSYKQEATASSSVISFTLNETTYNGNAQAVTFKWTINGNPTSSTLDRSYYIVKYNDTTTVPKDAGEYNVTIELTPAGQNVYSIQGGVFSGVYKINKKTITVDDSNLVIEEKIYNGFDTATTSGLRYSGNIAGEDIKVEAMARFTDVNAGSDKLVNVTYVIAGSSNIANYVLDKTSSVKYGSISKRSLSFNGSVVTAMLSNITKEYDGTVDYPLQEIALGQSISGIDKVYLKVTFNTPTVSNRKNIVWDITDAEGNTFVSDNYILPSDLPSKTEQKFGEITKKQLVFDTTKFTIPSSKEYDKSNMLAVEMQEGAIVGIALGDTIQIEIFGIFVNAEVGANKPVTINARFVNNNDSTAGCYILPTEFTVNSSIIKRKIILSDVNIELNKQWDNTSAANIISKGVISNLCVNDVVSFDINAVFKRGLVVSSTIGENMTIDVSFSNCSNNNYSLPDSYSINNASIVKRELVVSLPELVGTKIYDGNTNVVRIGNVLYENLVVGFSDVTAVISASYDDATAGLNKDIVLTFSELSGTHSQYYCVPEGLTVTGSISPKELTPVGEFTPKKTKEYDGTSSVEFENYSGGNIALLGTVGADVVTCNVTASYNNAVVGNNKTIIVRFVLSGDDAENYIVTNTVEYENCVISPKKLTIEVTNTTFGFGDEIALNISFGGKPDGLPEPLYDVLYEIDGSFTTDAPTQVGTYNFIVRIISSYYTTNDGSNYEGTLIIDKIKPRFTTEKVETVFSGKNIDMSLFEDKVTISISGVAVLFEFYDSTYGLMADIPSVAGTYYYKVYCEDSDNYSASKSEIFQELIIEKATAQIIILKLEQSFDGLPKAVEYITYPSGLNAVITYRINTLWTSDLPTSSGEYEVKGVIQDDNYVGEKISVMQIKSNVVEITVDKKNNDLIYDYNNRKFTGIYKGSAFEFVAKTNQDIPNENLVFSYYNMNNPNVVLQNPPIDAGDYILRVTIFNIANKSGSIEYMFTIEKKELEVKFDAESLTQVFDGTVKSAVATTTEDVDFIYTYTIGNREYNSVTNNGTYAVNATIDSNNYKGEVTGIFVIEKSTYTIVLKDNANDNKYEYTGAPFDAYQMLEIRDASNNVVDYRNIEVVFEYYDKNSNIWSSPILLGEYKIRAKFNDSVNYVNNSFTEYKSFSIVKANISININNLVDYNGGKALLSLYNPQKSYQFGVDDLTFYNGDNAKMNIFTRATFSYSINGIETTPVSVGEYLVRIALENHPEFNDAVFTATLVITAESLDIGKGVTIDKYEYEYDDKLEHSILITIDPSNIRYEIKYYAIDDVDRIRELTAEDRQAPGRYIGVITLLDPNYSGVFEHELIVNKKRVNVQVSENEYIYGDNKDVKVLIVLDDKVFNKQYELSYFVKDGNNYVKLDSLPYEAGTYRVVVTLVDDNYDGDTTVDYIIHKAELVVYFDDISVVYDGKVPTVQPKYSGFKYSDNESSILVKPTWEMNNFNVGDHEIALSGGNAANYRFVYQNGKVHITKRELKMSIRNTRVNGVDVGYVEMQEGIPFNLSDGANFNYEGFAEVDRYTNAIRTMPSIRIYDGQIDVTNNISRLAAGTYTLRIDPTAFSSNNYYLTVVGTSELRIYSDTIYSADNNAYIQLGKFPAGSVVNFGVLDNSVNGELYKAAVKAAKKGTFGSGVVLAYYFNVTNGSETVRSEKTGMTLNFNKPNIDYTKNIAWFYYTNDGKCVTITLQDLATDTSKVFVNGLNFNEGVLVCIEIKDYTWMLYVFIGIVGTGVAIFFIIRRVKFVKELPDDVEEKGEAIIVMPDQIESSKSEEEELAELIAQAERGELEIIEENKEEKPVDKQESSEKVKKQSVSDRLLNMMQESIKNDAQKNKNETDKKDKDNK